MFDKEEEKKFRVVCNSKREGEGVNIRGDASKVILLQNQHLHKCRLCQYINQTRMFVSVVSVDQGDMTVAGDNLVDDLR